MILYLFIYLIVHDFTAWFYTFLFVSGFYDAFILKSVPFLSTFVHW